MDPVYLISVRSSHVVQYTACAQLALEAPATTPLPRPLVPQIVDERMLVSVNDLLASGEIPDLFAAEDRDEIVNAMRGETKSLGLIDTTENCWATFINKASWAAGC